MAEAQQAAAGATTAEAGEANLLDQILDQTKPADTTERQRNKQFIEEVVRQALAAKPGSVVAGDVERTIKLWQAEIDKKLSAQLNEIMHHPDFQKLEGTWRGLDYLVKQSETGERLRIKVLNVSKKELAKDLEKAVEFDQSRLFKIVYEHEFGQLGGHPFGMMIGDYEFGKHPQDIEFLRKMAGVCSASHAPFIAAAGAEHVRPGKLHRAERPARPGQDLPERRLRRLEELPRERGQPVHRAGPAAGAVPAAVRGRDQADRGV